MTKFAGDEVMDYGNIKISNEVIAIISGLAANEIEGVSGTSGGIKGDLTEMLGMKDLAKGVKVEVGEKETAIDIYLVMKYGAHIAETAKKVQENIKKTVEMMTGLDVIEVNINIQGIDIPEESEIETDHKLK